VDLWVIYLAGLVGIPAAVGLAVRQWWVLHVFAVLFLLWLGAALMAGALGETALRAVAGALLYAILFLAPAELGAAFGVAVGRRLWPPRARPA
jgi:hypothetical protein